MIIRGRSDFLTAYAARRTKRGSITLFFCVVVTALSLVMGSWAAAAQARHLEAGTARAMAAQIESTLVRYDRPLMHTFGLLGFRSDVLSDQVFRQTDPQLSQRAVCELQPQKPLFEIEQLDHQLVRHMKTRLPLVWIETFRQRLNELKQLLPADCSLLPAGFSSKNHPAAEFVTTAAGTGTRLMNQTTAADSLETWFETSFADLDRQAIREAVDSLSGTLLASLENRAIDEIKAFYDAYKLDYLSVSENPLLSSGFKPDFMSPDHVADIAGIVDQLMDFTTRPLYEKLCVSEYVLAYLTPRVTTLEMDQTVALQTPDGRLMADLAKDRPCEVEQVLTGLKNDQTAALAVRVFLTSLRGVIQLAALLTDTTEMALIRTTATGIAGAVAAISCGSVVIEPETLTYIIVAGKALIAGIQDTAHLIDGQGVRLWPGIGQINLDCWYPDYLRLFLYLIPRSVLVHNSALIIKKVCGDSFYTHVSCRVQIDDRCYQQSGGYG